MKNTARSLTAAAFALSAIALTGCGAASQTSQQTPLPTCTTGANYGECVPRSSDAPAESAPSAIAPTPPVSQFVSEMSPAVQDAQESYNAYIASLGTQMCGMDLTTSGWSAQSLYLAASNLVSPTSQVYIGKPPAELAPLMDETQRVAKEYYKAAEKAKGCELPGLFTETHYSDMLDKWDPYLG